MAYGPDPFELGFGVATRLAPVLQAAGQSAAYVGTVERLTSSLRQVRFALRDARAENASLRQRLVAAEARANASERDFLELGRRVGLV